MFGISAVDRQKSINYCVWINLTNDKTTIDKTKLIKNRKYWKLNINGNTTQSLYSLTKIYSAL